MDSKALFEQAIAPKSDQLNGDDLIGRTITIKVREVRVKGGQQQPIDIFYEGDNNKPYKPCKTCARVLGICWDGVGDNFKHWIGRRMTLYRDPTVPWAGLEVGGIRISHVSHIKEARTIVLTASQRVKKPYLVKPLADEETAQPNKAATAENPLRTLANQINAKTKEAPEIADVDFILSHYADDLEKIKAVSAVAYKAIIDGADKRRAELRASKQDVCETCKGKQVVEDDFGKGPCPACNPQALAAE